VHRGRNHGSFLSLGPQLEHGQLVVTEVGHAVDKDSRSEAHIRVHTLTLHG
jgi:hypothetical protein